MKLDNTSSLDVFKKTFQNFGITESQFIDYLTLLKCGKNGSTCSAMALRRGYERNTMRYHLNALVKTKIVRKEHKNNTHYYYAEDPIKLLGHINFKAKQIEDWKKNFQNELPFFESHLDNELNIMGAEYFYGIEGVKKVYEDTIKNTSIDKIYAYENIEYMTDEIKEWILYDYIPRRAEKKIFIEVISPDNPIHRQAKRDDIRFFRETRFVKEKKFKIQCELNIYGNRIAFFSYKKDEMFGAILESNTISETMKATHQILWEYIV